MEAPPILHFSQLSEFTGGLETLLEQMRNGEHEVSIRAVKDVVKNMSSLVQDMTEASVSMISAANVASRGNLNLGQHTLINYSGDRVKQGTAMLGESGRTLEDIAKGTRKVGDIISEMAVDSIEQTRGVEKVNNAVTRVDEMTQQSLVLVEQVATASETLDKQSRSLQKMMALLEAGQEIASAPRRDNRLMGRSETQPTEARQGMRPQDDEEWNQL